MIVNVMNEPNIISIFETVGPIGGSRSHGAALRQRILENVNSEIVVKLDFQNVRTINASFSDEVIAKLVAEIGIEKFNKMVRLSNVNEAIKSVINFVVGSRLKQA